MKQRWLPVGIIAGGLFLVNVIARLIVRLAAGDDDEKQITIGLWALFAVGAVMVPAAVWDGRRHPMLKVIGDLGIAGVSACVLAVLVGAVVFGGPPLRHGVPPVFRPLFSFCRTFAVGAVMVPVAFWYGRRHPMLKVIGDLGIAVVSACVLAVLIGPFVSGVQPFGNGIGLVFRQFFYFVGTSAIGAAIGLLVLMTL